MNVKKLAPLVIALVFGIVAGKLALDFVHKKQADAMAPKHPQMVFAKHAMEAGAAFGPDDVVMGDGPDILPPNVFQSPNDLVGRVTEVPIVEGQAITQTLLAPKGIGSGLQAVIPPNMRAITLPIDSITGVAGDLTTGSHVDILLTVHDPKTDAQLSRMIAQNIKILQIGDHHAPDAPPSAGNNVTLLVTPKEAEALKLALDSGRPHFILRNGNDPTILTDDAGTSQGDIRDGYIDTKRPAPAPAAAPTPVTSANSAPVVAPPIPQPQDSRWTIVTVHGATETNVTFKTAPQITDTDTQSPDDKILDSKQGN